MQTILADSYYDFNKYIVVFKGKPIYCGCKDPNNIEKLNIFVYLEHKIGDSTCTSNISGKY
jgi:hypothetical protein